MIATTNVNIPEPATHAQRGALLGFLALHALERRGARGVSRGASKDDPENVLGWFGPFRVIVSTLSDRPGASIGGLDAIELQDIDATGDAWREAVEALREIEAMIGLIYPTVEPKIAGFDVSTLPTGEMVAEPRDINGVPHVRAVLRDGVLAHVDLRLDGEAEVWCSPADGGDPRLWARRSVEEAAELAEQLRAIVALSERSGQAAKARSEVEATDIGPEVCPWLTSPLSGTVVLEGRAHFPDEYALPSEQHGFDLAWGFEDGLWHFRGEAAGDPLLAAHVYSAIWFDNHPHRFDRVTYEAPAELEEGEGVDVVELDVDDDGVPTAVALCDLNVGPADLAQAVESLREVFGQALALGEWEHCADMWRAPVTRWAP